MLFILNTGIFNDLNIDDKTIEGVVSAKFGKNSRKHDFKTFESLF
jgi:hypothetical protein